MIRAPASGLLALVARAQRHQAGHLLLGEADFLAAELGEREVLDLERLAARFRGRVERVHFTNCSVIVSPMLLLSRCSTPRSPTLRRFGFSLRSPAGRVATNSAGPFASAIDGQRHDADVVEPRAGEQPP